MIGEISALIAAVCWAGSAVSIRRALQTTDALNATLASVLINAILLWPAALLLTKFDQVGWPGVAVLVAAGLLAPTFGRLLRFMAVEKLGVAPAAPLIATSPFFAAIFAVLLLGEEITLEIGLGTLFTMLGIVLLSSREEKVRLSRLGVMVSLVSAASFGLGDVIRKVGATLVGSPLLGAAVGASVAAPVYLLLGVATKRRIERPTRWTRFNVANGVFTTLALSFTFVALFSELVVIVEPLIGTTPLFTLVLIVLFLKKIEKVSAMILASSILVVSGSALIVLA